MPALADQVIVYQGQNDAACVLIPSPDCGLTIEEIAAKDVPATHPFRFVSRGQLPAHVAFLRAWRYGEDDDLPVVVDMPTAREVHRDAIRAARVGQLQRLDVQFVRLLEAGESLAEVVAAKQRLRDATSDPAIEAAETTAELIAQWDSDLLGPSPYLA